MKTIIALFSIENNYDQPRNNLICWWSEDPTIETLAKILNIDFNTTSDQNKVAIVNIYTKGKARIDNVDYRLEEIKAGIEL